MISSLQTVIPRVHGAGWPFIGLFGLASVVLWMLWEPLGLIGALLTVWCVYFFRDPDRVTPRRDGLLVSPADGLVQTVDRAPPPPELDMGDAPRPRVCVFMNVFNVHVNRMPIDGTVRKLAYRPGKFLNASLDKASVDNERMSIRVDLAHPVDGVSRDLAVVQIAGLVARRILCEARDGQSVRTGERFGLIRFGSRVDVYLPDGIAPLVVEGQTAIAGETVIADLRGTEGRRGGVVR